IACAIALLVFALTRVEGVGIAALFGLHRAGVLVADRRGPRRGEIIGAALFTALYATYVIWHWWYFRALVPNTYVAKSPAIRTGSIESALPAIRNAWDYAYIQLLRPYRFIVGVPLALVGLASLPRRLLALIATLLAGVAGVILLSGGDFYPQFRMGTLVLPLWFLLVVEGTRVVLTRVPPAAAVAAAVIPIAVMCQPSLAAASATAAGPLSLAVLKPFTADRFSEIAAGIRHRPIMVMEADIGNVAYFTDFAILDVAGLANLEIARNGYTAAQFRHYVFEEMKPDVIHLRGLFGWHTSIPVELIERDYRSIEGAPATPYATGWWVRRDAAAQRA